MDALPHLIRASRAGTIALLILCAPAALPAQAISAELVETGTAHPISGALAILLSGPTPTGVSSVTDERGRFYLKAPGAGAYRLRVLRIGFPEWVSDTIRLASAQVLRLHLELPVVPVQLNEIVVESKSPCRVDPARNEGTATLWEEARKALDFTSMTISRKELGYRMMIRRASLDRSLQVTKFESFVRKGVAEWPVSTLAPDSLALEGYVQPRDSAQGPIYYGPDATVLFSESFLGSHCFRTEKSLQPGTGLIGLAFEPVRDRELPDIEGVLWLDRKTAELRYLSYHYTKLWSWVPAGEAGGRIDFLRLPTGAWIVRRWNLRAPIVTLSRSEFGQRRFDASELRFFGHSRPSLFGFKEEGGEVTEVTDAKGKVIWAPALPSSSGATGS
ncbi:MAG: carboxypeptidase regulatory-like domain-containing protein [Gemmatimonadota bacterium]